MSSEPGSLTAVVLNWHQPDLTLRSVRGLVADGVPPERVVVVDNGSTDGSWEQFQAALRDCVLVRIADNVGFARGNNIGARALPGEAYLFVNSDAFVHRPGTISALIAALRAADVGIAVPKLLNEDLTLQPSVVPVPTPGVAFVRSSGLSRLIPNGHQPDWSVYWDHANPRSIQAAIGAVLLVRGALWRELGGLSETAFIYAEDLDICWRARELGWRVQFVPEAEFVHVGSGSTVWDPGGRGERVGRAEAAMIREHLSPGRARLTLALLRTGYLARSMYRRLTGDLAAAAECAGLARGYATPAAYRHDMEPGSRSAETIVLRPHAESEGTLLPPHGD